MVLGYLGFKIIVMKYIYIDNRISLLINCQKWFLVTEDNEKLE